MIRQKIVLNNYTYIVDYFFANEDLIENPHKEFFYLIRNQDLIGNISIDKDIYFIKKNNTNDIIFPITYLNGFGYSNSLNDFNKNLNDLFNDLNRYNIYDKDLNEISILCDKIRIYFPSINPNINAIIDLENFINDVKFHYFIDDLQNYDRYSETEFSYQHNIYSEFVEIYIPSIYELLYNSNIYIKDYNLNVKLEDNEKILNLKNSNNEILEYIPFNVLYYPFRISNYNNDSEVLTKKTFIITEKYINNQFYSTFNLILYPYTEIDNEYKYVIDNTYSSITFNIDLSFSLITEIRFPYLDEILNNESFYGIPSLICKFKYPNEKYLSIEESYLKYIGYSKEDYESYIGNENDDELIDDNIKGIIKTGFVIQMSSDKLFKDIFFNYNINIDTKNDDKIIDNLIFPLYGIFDSWDDVPSFIAARVLFVDRLSSLTITSNPVIITNEWYKYFINESDKHKLKLNNLYLQNDMIINDTEKILFIDKINCNIIKENDNSSQNIVYNNLNTPKVIYKPIFFRTTELNNISIKSNVKQNIGINLGEYMSKVETFKLIIDNNEYIEYGRNDIFVIFNINSKNITNTSGDYIILNENDDFISDGKYTIS